MANAPFFTLPDGSGSTQNLVVTTNLFAIFLNGTVDSSIIDIQININDAGFTSDPSLIQLSIPNFAIPNPNSFPNGLNLEKGLNTIAIRAIDISGSVSAVSTAVITVVSTSDLQFNPAPPTGISLQRRAELVDILWTDTDQPVLAIPVITNRDADLPVSGFNVYASTGAGGTVSGYLRVNKDLIPISNPAKTEVDELLGIESSFDIDDGGSNTLRITADIINPATNELVERLVVNTFPLLTSDKNRYKTSVTPLVDRKVFTFSHNRGDNLSRGILNSDIWQTVADDDPLFYVITSVVFDQTSGLFVESRFSQELTGGPLPIDRTVRGIRIRDQRTIIQGYIGEVTRAQPQLSLIPGSTIRELHIEPFANEVQKIYFLLDFVHRAKSFAALLQIDDPGRTGVSIDVPNSSYKQALKTALSIEDDSTVQGLIDGAFESLADNFNTERAGRRPANVEQTFFTTTRPTKDLIVQQDALVSSSTDPTAPRFRSGGQVVIESANADSFFNPNRGRYEITVQMIAESPGEIGNVPADTLDTVVSGAGGLSTNNLVAADFGRNEANNLELSEAASRTLVSLDTGTSGGYRNVAVSTPGVLEVRIVKSGDPCMFRDWDDVRKKHIGGKVDIYIKGTIERTVSETFAFQFNIARNVRFDVIDQANLIFRARDSRLSEENSIDEMLFNPSQNLGLRNQSVSPTESYDLTGVSILDFQTIQVNTVIPQPDTSFDDFIEGDFKFPSNVKFVPTLQPIERVISVTGEISGALDPEDGFSVFKTEDPLLGGFSTGSSNSIEVTQLDDIPSGESVIINNEIHTLVGQIEEPLSSVGINTFSINVFTEDRSQQFNGPENANPDYLIESGTATTPVKIVRTAVSAIANGETISVDYEHDENFVVTYVINDVLQRVQNRIAQTEHITADVLVKASIENPMAIEGTVQLLPNANKSAVDIDIRTNYTVLTDSKGVGGDMHVSDVSSVIDQTDGVDFIILPFAKFTLQDNALRVRESVLNTALEVPSLDKFANKVWVLVQTLPFNTSNGGGNEFNHRGVFRDGLAMDFARSLDDLGNGNNRAYIVGRFGESIPGFSDDVTLIAAGIDDAEERVAERLNRTANKVFISLNSGVVPQEIPSSHTFSASYLVEGDVGQKDVEISDVEFLTPGDLTLTFRETAART